MNRLAKFTVVLCLTLSFGLTLSEAREGPTAADDSYVTQLDGKGYNVMVAYQESEKSCSLIVKK